MTNDDSKTPDHDANIRSADQRATALAAASSIAASLALSGAAIIVDTGKLTSPSWIRVVFGLLLFGAVLLFTFSALTAIMGHREQWGGKVGVGKLQSEVSGNKHAKVTLSMWFLFLAMLCVVLLTAVSMFAAGTPPQTN